MDTVLLHARRVGCETGHFSVSSVQAAGELSQAFGECSDGDWFERIQLELAGFGRHRDGDVVADHAERDLVHCLGDDRFDLAGHDAGAGLDEFALRATSEGIANA